MKMSDITYKYWLFILKDEYIEDSPLDISEDYPLYAYTDSKELYNQFLEERDENRFLVVKKYLRKEEVSNLTREYRNFYLAKRELSTSSKNNEPENISLVMTLEEEKMMNLESMCILNNFVYKFEPFPVGIFVDSILKALKVLRYHDLMKVHEGESTVSIGINELKEFQIKIDELGVFIKLFKNTFKG
jgi:hypothetical protein